MFNSFGQLNWNCLIINC